ncbi:hypothetical protein OJ997_33695 [Solirubrobacter phytolaccae]|uniref:Uncharacterized protein n=1 Tax=Solirubrobacter phytolaccae TaxID=1404360 RepID=A0A9X3NF10_9ACTN|nr:hypothetical protein [Solirubrobacter phytolaccae]MDA0185308.1 hypothetical protein [Solirubrobacter phytolaccae]
MPALIVFSDDPLPTVFPSLEYAMGYMEGIDVENGEYTAIYTVGGRIVRAEAQGNAVELTITEERDRDDLLARLRAWRDDIDDPVEYARTYLRREWEGRWPKRPRWLDRRLHGTAPPPLEVDT